MSYDGRADTARVIPEHPLVFSYWHEITVARHASKVIYNKVAGSIRTLGYTLYLQERLVSQVSVSTY
jgi:hypothetical protein